MWLEYGVFFYRFGIGSEIGSHVNAMAACSLFNSHSTHMSMVCERALRIKATSMVFRVPLHWLKERMEKSLSECINRAIYLFAYLFATEFRISRNVLCFCFESAADIHWCIPTLFSRKHLGSCAALMRTPFVIFSISIAVHFRYELKEKWSFATDSSNWRNWIQCMLSEGNTIARIILNDTGLKGEREADNNRRVE